MKQLNDIMVLLKRLESGQESIVGASHVEITFMIWEKSYTWRVQESDFYEMPRYTRISFRTYNWQYLKKTFQEYIDELAKFLFDLSLTHSVVDAHYDVTYTSSALDYYFNITKLNIELEPSDDGQTNIDADFIELLLKLMKPRFRNG